MFNGKHIVIYTYDDLTLDYLIDTVIHEYIHHLQFEKKAHENDYNKKHNEVGYWCNPYEILARHLAKQNRKECLEWVLGQINR